LPLKQFYFDKVIQNNFTHMEKSDFQFINMEHIKLR